jgi:hypothetical protein
MEDPRIAAENYLERYKVPQLFEVSLLSSCGFALLQEMN